MVKYTQTHREIRNMRMNIRKLAAELDKTKKDAARDAKSAREFMDMAFEAKKKFEEKLELSRQETQIFRKSLKNFNSVCYKQRKEIRALKKYISRRKARKMARRARTKTIKH